jgi:hypothetical protein
MASPALVAPVASAAVTHQAGQAGLVDFMAGGIDQAWGLFNPNDPSTFQALLLAIKALIQHFGSASSSAAAAYYDHERQIAGIHGTFRAHVAPTADEAKIEKSVRWAVSDAWGPTPDLAAAKVRLTGVAEKNVLDSGRQTIIDNVHADKKAKGWARVPEAGACSFCALLATRGMVYRSAKSADFRSHDHCRCHAVAIFNAYEPSAQIREWQQIYSESTKGVHGPVAMRRAFRKALSP